MKFRKESVRGIELEVEGLAFDHFEEVSPFQDIPPDPNIQFYHVLEDKGMLRVFTARDTHGNLCGYALFFVQKHPHFNSKQALCDILYLMPQHRSRGVGQEFIEFCDSSLQSERDIAAIYFSSTAKKPIGKLFERLGYEMADIRYAKRVNADG